MVESFPPVSLALGFWAKHPEAMLAFEYEHDDDTLVPVELQKIFDVERYRDMLDQILEASGEDGNSLLHAIADETAVNWARHPMLVVERRKAYNWSEKFFVRRKRRGRDAMELGFYLRANSQLGVTLYVYLWTKGGKAAAEFNANCIREVSGENVLKGADDKTRYWVNGILLLARVPLREFMTDAGELDSKSFFEHSTAQIARCTGDALVKILESIG